MVQSEIRNKLPVAVAVGVTVDVGVAVDVGVGVDVDDARPRTLETRLEFKLGSNLIGFKLKNYGIIITDPPTAATDN